MKPAEFFGSRCLAISLFVLAPATAVAGPAPILKAEVVSPEPGSTGTLHFAPELRLSVGSSAPLILNPECPYDPNDPAAVEAFWKNATVRRPGQRGPGKKAKKVLLSMRYSSEVVEYFKSTGEGWQTRMDEVLKEWVASHRSRS